MKRVRILAVGRLKVPHWLDAAGHYQNRLAHSLRLDIVNIKDADANASLVRRKEQEGERLLKQSRPGDVLICLDEGGKTLNSRQFAELLRGVFDAGKAPCFLIGGAYGLAEGVKAAAQHCISFGPMTFPHEMARVMLLEQLYRVENILAGTGYHH